MTLPPDPGAHGVLQLLLAERARDLSQRLRLPVLVHDLGWRSTEIEVEITRLANGAIAPLRVVMGPAAIDLMLVDQDGVHGRCQRYNAIVGQLRSLARQLAYLHQEGRVALRPGSPLAYTRAMLEPLDDLIARREREAFGRGAVRLTALDHEIEFFAGYHACFAPIMPGTAGDATRAKASFHIPVPLWRRGRRRRRLESAS